MQTATSDQVWRFGSGLPFRLRVAAAVLTFTSCGGSPGTRAGPGGSGVNGGAGVGAGTGGGGGTGGAAGPADDFSCAGQTSGTWVNMSTTNAPPPSTGAGLFWTGTELYVYGVTMGRAALYTPCADTWRAAAATLATQPWWTEGIPVTSANKLLFFGPTQSPPVFFAFDYRQNQQASLSTTGMIEAEFAGVVTTGSKLIAWGGALLRDPKDASSGYDGSQVGAIYDPPRDAWSPTASAGAPSPRVAPGVWTGSSFVVWGGHSGDTYMKEPYQYDCARFPDAAGCAEYGDGAAYDLARDSWTPLAATGAPAARFKHILAWTGDRVLVWGGSKRGTMTKATSDSLDEIALWDGALYDPGTNTWTPAAPCPVAPDPGQAAAYYYVWTGDRLAVGANGSASGSLYDPRRNTWSNFDAPANLEGCSDVPKAQAGALIASCSVAKVADYMLLLPGETKWRRYPAPVGLADHPSVLWTGRHLFVWGGTEPSTFMCPPPTPQQPGCDPPPPTYSNAGYMLLP